MQIDQFKIDGNNRVFVIAELSANHNGSLDVAIETIRAAKRAGADCIKLQTYKADTITIDSDKDDFVIKDTIWEGRKLYDLYQEAYTPWDWHKALFDRARERRIFCFSTPFDDTAVDFLESLDMPVYKVASFENNHLPLLKKIASTGKPVIMSTGISTIADIEIAVKTLRENGCKDLILLKCTSTYPATPENTNIRTIPHMADLFNCHVGLSDHTMGVGTAVAAVASQETSLCIHLTQHLDLDWRGKSTENIPIFFL